MAKKELKENEFNFEARITRAVKKDGKIILTGVASSDSVDWYQTRFNTICQENWLDQINSEKGVPVIMELNHDGFEDWTARCGKVNRAWTLPNIEKKEITDFHIEAEIDQNHYINYNDFLYNAINNPKIEYGQPKQMALSINGFSKPGKTIMVDNLPVEDFSECTLFAIGIVEYGANPDTYVNAIKRSIVKGEKMANKDSGNPEIKTEETNVTRETIPAATPDIKREKDETDTSYIQKAVEEVNEIIGEFQQTVTALSESDLTVSNILYAMKIFLEKYENNAYWKICETMWDYQDEVLSKQRSMLKTSVEFCQRAIENSKVIEEEIENIKRKKEKGEKMANENQNVADVKPEATNTERSAEVPVNADSNSDVMTLLRSMSADFATVKTTLEKVQAELTEVKREKEEVKTENEKLKVENESVKREKVEATAKVEQLSQTPSTVPAVPNVTGDALPAMGITREMLVEGLKEGKFDAETDRLVRSSVILSHFNINY